MSNAGDSGGDEQLNSAASGDSFGSLMLATLADLVSQSSGDIESLNNAIHTAETLLADAPADIFIPSGCWENLAILFAKRYQMTKDPDDLQTVTTWTELSAAAVTQEGLDRDRCGSKVAAYRVSSDEQTGNTQDPHDAGVQVNDAMPETPQDVLTVDWIQSLNSVRGTSGAGIGVQASAEISDDSLDSISAIISDLATQHTNEPKSLDNAILLAENILAAAPHHTIRATCFNDLSRMLNMRYILTANLDDLEKAIELLELAVAAISPDEPNRVPIMINLSTLLSSRFERIGDLNDLQQALLLAEEVLAGTSLDHHDRADRLSYLSQKLGMRFERTGDLDNLERAVFYAEEAVDVTSLYHPNRAYHLNNLAQSLSRRFERTGDLDNLKRAIMCAEEAVTATPVNYPNRAVILSNLSIMLMFRFERTGDIEDLPRAILLAEEAVGTFPQNHPNRVMAMSNLSAMLNARFNHTGDLDDLRQAISQAEKAVTATPLDHPARANDLLNLSLILSKRFERTGDLDALQLAILRAEEAVTAFPLNHLKRASGMNNLSSMLAQRFERTGDLENLQLAIFWAEEAVAATPQDDCGRPIYLGNLALTLRLEFERTGNLDDLQRAILRAEDALASLPLNHQDRASSLCNLSLMICQRFRSTGNVDDMHRAILGAEEVVAATPLDNPHRASNLCNLANCLSLKFEITENLNHLQQAILRAEEAVVAFPLDHPGRVAGINTLATMLGLRFERTRDLDDLQQAILWNKMAVDATPLDHCSRAGRLNTYSMNLHWRFERTGNLDDLHQAIMRAEEAVDATPLKNPDRALYLSTLSSVLSSRYELTRNPDDLKQAILRSEEAVTIPPLDHLNRAGYLITLAFCLIQRFKCTGDLEDLQHAVLRFEQVVTDSPEGPNRIIGRKNLGIALSVRYKLTNNPHDHKLAICYLRESVAQHSAAPIHRIEAALTAAPMLEEDNNWEAASEIREIAVNLLPRISSRSLGRMDQQYMIKSYAGLASDAAAAALRAGKSATVAVKLLELGRGVIANLQFETRTDLTDLRELHSDMANEFEHLRDDLDESNSLPSVSMNPIAHGASRRHKTSLELDKMIDRIRGLPNFQNFLLPPTAHDLMMAAAPMRPVVLINVSSFRCDAILIQQHNITTLNLPRLHKSTINGVARVMKSRSPTTHQMLELLKWLWDVLAEPVLEELGFREAVESGGLQWPRVCWIPTGPLCHLPIHAAGYHCEPGSRTVLDRVISSYSPSIKALLYGRRNEAQRIPSRSRASNKTILVSMATTLGCSKLEFAENEIMELNRLLPAAIPREILHEPQKEEVLTALDGCSVFHFAGHGLSHTSDPSMSTLLMADWQTNPLTVKDLVALKFHQSPPLLAYLSACSTGDNKETKLLDEGIHLMGACQLAGFRHVIGSLWEVSDKHCVETAKDVYETMINAGMSDESVSLGLHNAVLNLRGGSRDRTSSTREARNARLIESEETQDNMIRDPYIWAAYIHMGI
ncbi:CHAT domain-containing protein [Trichophaea hybrida]|nr:CHAT domain-containing protein [Trichophaea hybrida]